MRAIRITQANWLNDEVGGDRNTVKLVRDEMAFDAVEVHHIAEYAPEYDQPETREIPVMKTAAELIPDKPEVIDFPAEPEPEVRVREDPAPEPEDAVPLRRPWSTASKAEWITWAVHGDNDGWPITEEAAAQLTKAELMSRYGERL